MLASWHSRGAGGAGGVTNAWDISTAAFLQSFSVVAKETAPRSAKFKPDGLKMYIIGTVSDSVHEYDLSVAWDISTAGFLQSFSVRAQESGPCGLAFKPDGLKMYTIGFAADSVIEYDLSTAWDISTAVFIQLFSVRAQDNTPFGVTFKPDGLKMYIVGTISDSVIEYNLSTAWDVSTAVLLQSFSVVAQDNSPFEAAFKPDGLKMYIVGTISDSVIEYSLSTAWDISTAVFLQSFIVAAEEQAPCGVELKPDGLKMYIVGFESDSVHEYDLG